MLWLKALNEDEFHEQWDQSTQTKVAPAEFIPAVITYAQTYEKKEVSEILSRPLQDFLQHRHAIGLANEVFNIFAPKMTLARFYNEVIPSGGTYKGWTVHNAAALSYPVTLTEEEKGRFPDLENKLRVALSTELSGPNNLNDIFSSCERVVSASEKIRDQFELKEDEMIVEYIYDPCLRERGCGVDGTGPKRFYLSRSVKSQLSKSLS